MSIPSLAHPSPSYYDSRKDLGYGKDNKYHKPRSTMGGDYGIYNPKGQWDNELELEKLCDCSEEDCDICNEDEFSELNAKQDRMTFSSVFRRATDSMAKKGTTPFSFVDSSTRLDLSHDIKEKELLEDFIRESISGTYWLRKSPSNILNNTGGELYTRKNVTSDKASGQAAAFTRGGSHGHYKRTGNRFAVSGHATGKTKPSIKNKKTKKRKKVKLKTTWDYLNPDNVDFDLDSVLDHQNRVKKITRS